MLPRFTPRARTRRTALVAAARPPAPRLRPPRAGARRGRPRRTSAPRRDVPSSTHKVTLVTGDVVTLTTLADGQQHRGRQAPGRRRRRRADADARSRPVRRARRGGGPARRGPAGPPAVRRHRPGRRRLRRRRHAIRCRSSRPTRAPRPGAAACRAHPQGSTVVRRLPSVRGAALTAAKPGSARSGTPSRPTMDLTDPTPTLADGIAKLWLDGKVQADPRTRASPQIGAPEAWAAGYDGTGVTVAVLDTGVDVTPPRPRRPGRRRRRASSPSESVADGVGHGTHVASTIAGTGAAQDGYYKGVAPGAKLDVGKVLDDTGSGQDSWILAGMEWAAAVGRQGRQHEPRRHRRRRRHRPDVAGGRRALRAVRHAVRRSPPATTARESIVGPRRGRTPR